MVWLLRVLSLVIELTHRHDILGRFTAKSKADQILSRKFDSLGFDCV